MMHPLQSEPLMFCIVERTTLEPSVIVDVELIDHLWEHICSSHCDLQLFVQESV